MSVNDARVSPFKHPFDPEDGRLNCKVCGYELNHANHCFIPFPEIVVTNPVLAFKNAAEDAGRSMDTLRASIATLLTERGIKKLPKGNGEYWKVPDCMNDMPASEVLSWAAVIQRLIGDFTC